MVQIAPIAAADAWLIRAAPHAERHRKRNGSCRGDPTSLIRERTHRWSARAHEPTVKKPETLRGRERGARERRWSNSDYVGWAPSAVMGPSAVVLRPARLSYSSSTREMFASIVNS